MNQDHQPKWSADQLLELGRSYQAAAVFAAAADLDLFPLLAHGPIPATEAAHRLGCDLRGLAILLDALAALGLLEKQGNRYGLLPGTDKFLNICLNSLSR